MHCAGLHAHAAQYTQYVAVSRQVSWLSALSCVLSRETLQVAFACFFHSLGSLGNRPVQLQAGWQNHAGVDIYVSCSLKLDRT